MKAKGLLHGSCETFNQFSVRPIALGLCATVLIVSAGCVSEKPAGVIHGSTAPIAEELRVELGTIALVSSGAPAQFGFDQARGQVDDAGDAAGYAAGRALDIPFYPEIFIEGAMSVMSLGFAPVAAAHGAILARQTMTPENLARCENNLRQAMTTMAAQKRFQECVLQAAAEKTRRRLIPTEPGRFDPGRVDAVLETEVQQLRLVRTGKGDTSFALHITAHTRLVRTADNAVLFESPIEYKSGTCLFREWTLHKAFEGVAETGYRALANQLVDRLFVATAQGPVLAGAGYKRAPMQSQNEMALARNNRLVEPTVQFVSDHTDLSASIDVFSSAAVPSVTVQQPLTRDQAVSEAVEDVEYQLDGLYNHCNPAVAVPACLVAIPLSLYKQGDALVRGLSPKALKRADAQLTAALRPTRPHEEMASAVAHRLAAQTAQNVVLFKSQLSPDGNKELVAFNVSKNAPSELLPISGGALPHRPGQAGNTVLQIHILSAALNGDGVVNPLMSLNLEAELRWLRARDGQEVYSCPINYRSTSRKYAQWADNHAQLLRQELQQCYREVGTAVVEQLVSHRMVIPNRATAPVLANN